MVNTQDIKNILDSSDFQSELEEMSSYAASMKQERPIVLLLSKYLWRQGHKAAPELWKCDPHAALYFLDHVHLTAAGTTAAANSVCKLLQERCAQALSGGTPAGTAAVVHYSSP